MAQDTNKEDQKLSQSEDIQHESLNNEDVSLTSNKTDDSEHLEKDSLNEDKKLNHHLIKLIKHHKKCQSSPVVNHLM